MRLHFFLWLWIVALIADISYRMQKYCPTCQEERRQIVAEAVWQAKQEKPK